LPQPSLHTNPVLPFIELKTVDSTNNYALTQLHEGLAHHGTAYFAGEQVAGKGQRGKTWLAAKDSSILLSIVINPDPLTLNQQFQLSACVAASVCGFFNSYVNGNACIKWPNDLYWQDRKAGGILIENIIGSRVSKAGSRSPEVGKLRLDVRSQISNDESQISDWLWAVIGIGININQTTFSEDLQNPVSLKQITGKDYSPAEMAKELCTSINKNFNQLITLGFDAVYSSYLSFLYKKNDRIKLKKGSRVFEAIIKTVSPSGKLVVEHAIEEEFDFGEIEWLIPRP